MAWHPYFSKNFFGLSFNDPAEKLVDLFSSRTASILSLDKTADDTCEESRENVEIGT